MQDVQACFPSVPQDTFQFLPLIESTVFGVEIEAINLPKFPISLDYDKKFFFGENYAASASDGFLFEWSGLDFYFPFVRVMTEMGESRTYAQHKNVTEMKGAHRG